MASPYTVGESLVQRHGGVRHIVQGPGGDIIVDEDVAGNLSARIRRGYVIGEESEEETVARGIEAVQQIQRPAARNSSD